MRNLLHEAMGYEIVVQGEIDPRRASWFEGLTMINRGDGTTSLSGELDQAALHASLNRIRDLGLLLISVKLV